MSNFEDSSFHNNNGRRMMSPEMEDYYHWEEIRSSNIDICRAFLKLCVVEDPIWEKITCELEEPFFSTAGEDEENILYMDQDSAHMVAASKVPMLKPGEYELWRMRMEQYIQMINYSLWEVIENGNAPPITKVVEGVETTIAPTTAEEKH
ncbi:hypothetical protein Tco_0655618 [Tanacetum coccineum]|uniref:Uncharacterized protein n=1 Tax=Tanacetum coccineum TaxID=301880 RepID=A0ABQ4X6L2_9ASTR